MNPLKMVLSICAITALALACGAEGEKPDSVKALSKALMEWDAKVRTAEGQARKDAVKEWLPTKEDIQQLFPKDADRLWPWLEKKLASIVADSDQLAEEFSADGKLLGHQVIDVRTKDTSGQYARILELIPKDVPIYKAIRKVEADAQPSGTYFFLRNRWVFFAEMDGVRKLLARNEK